MKNGLGHEADGIYYLDYDDTSIGLFGSSSKMVLWWHCHLAHPSLQKLTQVTFLESSIPSLQ